MSDPGADTGLQKGGGEGPGKLLITKTWCIRTLFPLFEMLGPPKGCVCVEGGHVCP